MDLGSEQAVARLFAEWSVSPDSGNGGGSARDSGAADPRRKISFCDIACMLRFYDLFHPLYFTHLDLVHIWQAIVELNPYLELEDDEVRQ
jgi:hypothetical protein